MSQWGATGNQSSNSVKWAARSINAGSGKAAQVSNNTTLFQNTTPESFSHNGVTPFLAIGQFGFSAAQEANGAGENPKVESAGWNMRRAFEGPIVSFAVGTSSGNTANGESILVSNGSVNAYGIITTNSSGNMTSVSVGNSAGRFVNSSAFTYAFTREKHMMNVTVTTPGANSVNLYSNSDFVVWSNGISNGTGNVTTTASGNLASIAITNPGLYINTAANNTVVFTIFAANGATSNGEGGVLTANLGTSVGGAVTATAGGRSGRVQYECLAALTGMLATNSTTLPS